MSLGGKERIKDLVRLLRWKPQGGSGLFYIVGDNVINNLQRQVNLIDNFSVIDGSHQLKFGVDYRRLSPINIPPDYGQQVLFFGGGLKR